MVKIAKQPRVWSGTQWEPLAVTLPDLSNYSTTTQIASTYSPISTTGLVLVSSQALSASSGISFTNLEANARYRIIGTSIIGSVLYANLNFYFRENSTDKTTGYYHGRFATGSWGTNTGAGAPLSLVEDLATSLSESVSFGLDFFIDSSRDTASMLGQSIQRATIGHYIHSVFNGAMTDCNGISILPASGTISGTINLYKYI